MIKRGVYAAGLSIIKDDMSLDIDSTIAHAEKIIKNGLHGVFFFGSTGQSQYISISEKKDFISKIAHNKLRNILLSDDIFNNENQSEMWIFDMSEIIINNLEIISNEDAFKIISFYNEIDTLNLKKDIELSIFEKD